ncbi:MAG: helix-turn-helix domain-containing protein [Sedimentisphaerales bacterium]
MNNFEENFALRLRDTRNKAGLTQEQLGEKLGFKGNTAVYRFEADVSSPSIAILSKLASVLNVDLHWLITGESSLAVKRLKPFAEAHLQQKAKEMQDLEAERAELQLKGSFGGGSGLRCDEIRGELENLRLYCQTVRQVLNEVLAPLGESL